MRLRQVFWPQDWKRAVAMVILWTYTYQLVVWPMWFNVVVYINAIFDKSLPAPVLLPWESLIAGTTTLAAIGGIQVLRDQRRETTE